MVDPDVEGFLALLAARRAPRTVDAYRRDLAGLRAFLGKPVSRATVADLELYTAQARADGLSSATLARRAAAARTFFRHLQLVGARADNPAAELSLPRRTRKLPRTLSTVEAERLIDAANGVAPRALRDRALVELLYGAGLRVSEAVGLEKGGVDLDERLVRVTGKGDKERIVPIGRQAAEALRRYLARGRPHLDRRHRSELFLNARGGPLTRSGAFLILRRLAAVAGLEPESRPPAPPPPLLRDPSARGRRRPAQRAGDARARRPRDDRALHARIRSPPAGVVLPGAPACEAAQPRRGAAGRLIATSERESTTRTHDAPGDGTAADRPVSTLEAAPPAPADCDARAAAASPAAPR